MEILTGSIKRETAKAIYFVTGPESREDLGAAWWPKSQIQIFGREIRVPSWLLAAKQREEDLALA